jgi:hypothetical protein
LKRTIHFQQKQLGKEKKKRANQEIRSEKVKEEKEGDSL